MKKHYVWFGRHSTSHLEKSSLHDFHSRIGCNLLHNSFSKEIVKKGFFCQNPTNVLKLNKTFDLGYSKNKEKVAMILKRILNDLRKRRWESLLKNKNKYIDSNEKINNFQKFPLKIKQI